jgi:hypothetical protein
MFASAQPSRPFELQRRWKRYRINVPVRLAVNSSDLTAHVNGRGTELNEGGMCVVTGGELNLSDQIELEFTLPYASEPLRIRAAVRNRYGCFYGLEFLIENAGERDEVGRQVLKSLTGNA